MGVGLARQEHEARGVRPDLVHHVLEGLELARAGGHGDLLAVAEQVDQVDQDHGQAALFAERLARGHHARHVAVMVRAPDVDDQVEAALELVVVVGDVRREIGGVAVALAQHAVLVVAQLGGPEPERAVSFKAHARGGQVGEGLVHLAVRHQGFFREPDVVAHAEGRKVLPDGGKDVAHAALLADLHGLGLGEVQDGGVVGQHVAGDVDDVVAPVVIFRLGHVLSGQLLEPVPDGGPQDEHLAARVVDVILGLHVIARLLQDADQGVAQGRAPAVADVQRAGGVGGHVLHLDLDTLAHVGRAVGLAGIAHGGHGLAPEGRREGEIQESRPGDVDLLDERVIGQGCGDILGNGAGGLFGLLGEHHGHVGGHIAELLSLGGSMTAFSGHSQPLSARTRFNWLSDVFSLS